MEDAASSPKNFAISKGFVLDAKVKFEKCGTEGKVIGYCGGRLQRPILRIETKDGKVVRKSMSLLQLISLDTSPELRLASSNLQQISGRSDSKDQQDEKHEKHQKEDTKALSDRVGDKDIEELVQKIRAMNLRITRTQMECIYLELQQIDPSNKQ